MTNKSITPYLSIIGLLLVGAIGWYVFSLRLDDDPRGLAQPTPFDQTQDKLDPVMFDGQRAYADVKAQVALGPRTPGSEGHDQVRAWMVEALLKAGWQVEVQASEALGHTVYNIIARRNDESPQIIIGAHYDSRIFADNDPDLANRAKPVPGANDGASGVAVLLEIARSLPEDTIPVWLVFFDAEDNGNIEGWDWILGSREFVENNSFQPRAVIVVDMIGDADLNIFKERNSNPELTDEIWAVAKSLGYESKFIPEYKYSMIDDHTPFLQAGLPAMDIIDFDYPYWHTTQDTPDKVSAESLEIVGKTLWTWVAQQSAQP